MAGSSTSGFVPWQPNVLYSKTESVFDLVPPIFPSVVRAHFRSKPRLTLFTPSPSRATVSRNPVMKCQETRPACGHCVKTGLKCDYPATPQITHQPHHQIPLFSLQDMRFFQHFLMQCYPSHPPANEHIWTHEVPCLSQNVCYFAYNARELPSFGLLTSISVA
jgi:hypothetical protein